MSSESLRDVTEIDLPQAVVDAVETTAEMLSDAVDAMGEAGLEPSEALRRASRVAAAAGPVADLHSTYLEGGDLYRATASFVGGAVGTAAGTDETRL